MNERYRFSRQEEKVLLLSISGMNDKEISEQIGVGLGTVRTFWKRIRAKSGGGSRAEIMGAFDGVASQVEGVSDQGLRLIAEVAKREDAEARFATLLDAVSDPVIAFDREGRCVNSNTHARDITGYTQAELAVTPLSSLYHESTKLLSRKDGTTTPVDATIAHTASGGSLLVVHPSRSATNQTLLERAIRRARIGQIVVTSPGGQIEFANDRIADLLAYPTSEVLGRKLHDLVAASDRTRLDQTLQRSITNGEAQCSLSLLHRNGSFVNMFVDAAYLPPEDGAAHQVVTIRRMADAGRLLAPRSARLG